jgi:hypothetical protein
MTQENTCTILHFKIPLSEYRVFRGALKQKIAEDLSVSVDIVRLRDNMNQSLKNRILEEGISV